MDRRDTKGGDTINEITYPDVVVQLSGHDGNAFAVIGTVRKALWRQVGSEAAQQFVDEAKAVHSYDELLQLVMRTVEVE